MSSPQQNPFSSPQQVPANIPPQPGDDKYAACPSCGARNARIAGFTWWGGVLGPKMLTHVICRHCNTAFNGKTGQSNTTGIAIYTAVSLVIALGIGIAFIAWTWSR